MIDIIKKSIFETNNFEKLQAALLDSKINKNLLLNNLFSSLPAFIVTHILESNNRQVLLVTPDKDTAEKLYDDCLLLLGKENVCLFGERPSKDVQLLDLKLSMM